MSPHSFEVYYYLAFIECLSDSDLSTTVSDRHNYNKSFAPVTTHESDQPLSVCRIPDSRCPPSCVIQLQFTIHQDPIIANPPTTNTTPITGTDIDTNDTSPLRRTLLALPWNT